MDWKYCIAAVRQYGALFRPYFPRQLLSFLALVAFVIAVPLFDAFDVDATRAFFYRAASVSYPTAPDARVSVVLATDASLTAATYPLPFAFHAKVMDALKSVQPRSVLIDFTFPDERPDDGLGAFVSSLRSLREIGTIIYIGLNESTDQQHQ